MNDDEMQDWVRKDAATGMHHLADAFSALGGLSTESDEDTKRFIQLLHNFAARIEDGQYDDDLLLDA